MVRDLLFAGAAVWVSIVTAAAGTFAAAGRQTSADHASSLFPEPWLLFVLINTFLGIIHTSYLSTSVSFAETLSAAPECGASRLDRSMPVYGTGLARSTTRSLRASHAFDRRRAGRGEGHLRRLTHITKFSW